MNSRDPAVDPAPPYGGGIARPGDGAHDARPGDSRRGHLGVRLDTILRNTVLVTAVLLAVLALAVVTSEPTRLLFLADFPAFTVLLVAAAASAGLRFGKGSGRVAFSFTSVVLLAAIPILGPVGATVLGIGAAVLDAGQGRWQASAFNGAMLGLSAAAASLAYVLAGGDWLSSGDFSGSLPENSRPLELVARLGIPLLTADVAFILTNLAVILLVTPVDPAMPSRRPIIAGALMTVPTFIAWAIVAFVLVVLWGPGELSALAVLLVIAPLVMTRRIHGLFAEERATRASIIDALARAGHDDGGKAHGERVLGYTTAVAAHMGLRPADRSALHDAARLHAVALSGACTVGLRASSEAAAGVSEAVAGERLIGLMGFLDLAASAVRHEPEWVDGTGGPDGRAGEAIPLPARILAVADAADVLVQDSRATHPEQDAMRRLRAMAGSRFDPDVVEALASILGVADEPLRATDPRQVRRAAPSREHRRGGRAVRS